LTNKDIAPYDRATDTSESGTDRVQNDESSAFGSAQHSTYADQEQHAANQEQDCGSADGRIFEEKQYLLTEGGFAERIKDTFGHILRYSYDRNVWYYWNQKCWQPDTRELTFLKACAREVVRQMMQQAFKTGDGKLLEFAESLDKASRLRSVFGYLQSLSEMFIHSEEFDADLDLVNCEDGTVSLRTGEIGPHRREDLITKMAPVGYDPGAICPVWDETLESVFHGDQQLIGYFGRAIGYALMGTCSEKAMFVEYGPAANNGKTTVMHAIRRVLGDEQYALEFDPGMLLSTRDSGGYRPRGDIAALRGIRLAEGEELEGNREISSSLIKRLVGGADTRIRAREVYQAASSFINTATIFLSTNAVLRAKMEPAMANRLFIIPFDTVYVNTEEEANRRRESGQQYVGLVDKTRQERLDAERPGIFNWVLRHCLEYRAQGLNPPAAAMEAKDRYIRLMDVIGCFVDECCELDLNAKTTVRNLLTRYQQWCKECGEPPMRKTDFTSELQNKGVYKTDEKTDGRYWYTGIRLKA